MTALATSDTGHVHFPEEEVSHHEAEILMVYKDKFHMDVKLGFLQAGHIYEIKFSFKSDLGDDIQIESKGKKHSVRAISHKRGKDGHDVIIEFCCHKEQVVSENLIVTTNTKPKKKLILQLCARILGKGKGTPILKEGIRIIHTRNDDESELSDSHCFSD